MLAYKVASRNNNYRDAVMDSEWYRKGVAAALNIDPGDIYNMDFESKNPPADPEQRKEFERGWQEGLKTLREKLARGEPL
jgi:hypothetical protein